MALRGLLRSESFLVPSAFCGLGERVADDKCLRYGGFAMGGKPVKQDGPEKTATQGHGEHH